MFRQFGATQAAPGRQQRQSVEHIGFTGTIRSRQHDGPPADREFGTGIRAKIGQRHACDGEARRGLAAEAIRLARLIDTLMPAPAIKGLLALMLLQDARRAARATAQGDIILLEDQDRLLWDRGQIAEGLSLVEAALATRGPPSSYAVQAAIAALHAQAASHAETDGPQIAGLYAGLARIQPSPVIELNRAVAVSMVDGPARALDLVDALIARGELAGYHLAPAVRADFLRRLGRRDEAAEAYRAALALAQLEPERRLLARRLAQLA